LISVKWEKKSDHPAGLQMQIATAIVMTTQEVETIKKNDKCKLIKKGKFNN